MNLQDFTFPIPVLFLPWNFCYQE